MDVEYKVCYYSMPRSSFLEINSFVKQHRQGITLLDEWHALDIWFEANYNARRRDVTPFWYFPNKEKYMELYLKWM